MFQMFPIVKDTSMHKLLRIQHITCEKGYYNQVIIKLKKFFLKILT